MAWHHENITFLGQLNSLILSFFKFITLRLEAIALRLEAIAGRLEAIASRLEAIMAIRLEAVASRWKPSLVGWRPLQLYLVCVDIQVSAGQKPLVSAGVAC